MSDNPNRLQKNKRKLVIFSFALFDDSFGRNHVKKVFLFKYLLIFVFRQILFSVQVYLSLSKNFNLLNMKCSLRQFNSLSENYRNEI